RVAGRGHALIGLVDIADPIAVRRQLFAGIVAAAVVDNNDFDVAVGLCERTFDGLGHEAAVVIRGDDSRDQVVNHASLLVAGGSTVNLPKWIARGWWAAPARDMGRVRALQLPSPLQ